MIENAFWFGSRGAVAFFLAAAFFFGAAFFFAGFFGMAASSPFLLYPATLKTKLYHYRLFRHQ